MLAVIITVALCNILQCAIYYGTDKATPLYSSIYILSAAFATGLFYLSSRSISDSSQLFKYGVYYDTAIVATWTVIPFLVFDVKLTKMGVAGLLLILLGTVLLKMSDNSL
jgi:multidrug transporter EmrE-like cation transporter